MLFNSLKFVAFFPVVTAGYFVLPRRLCNLWLLAMSYLFYMCWNPRYALLMLGSTAITWGAGLLLERAGSRGAKKGIVGLAVGANLAILFLFKYAGFLLENINALRQLLGMEAVFSGFSLLLPVGISFYTFQAIGYTVDVYRGSVAAEKNPFRYALFVSFFPQLVAGPIERSKNMLDQFAVKHRFDYDRFKSGLILMLGGYLQKLVIADRLALLVDAVYADPAAQGTISVALAMLFFPLQLYCDFSSYSDIAIGAARIMGFDLMQNFDSPYLATSLGEYWNRWHISLSSWLKDYLYIPLGGNRCRPARSCLNLFIVFLASGLWHGAAWTYVIWGALHGLWMVAGRAGRGLRTRVCAALRIDRTGRLHRFFCWLLTFGFLVTTFVVFRAPNMEQAGQMLARLLCWDGGALGAESFAAWGMDKQDFIVSLAAIALLVAADLLRRAKGPLHRQLLQKPLAFQWAVLLCGILALVVFGMYGQGYVEKPFIYFQF